MVVPCAKLACVMFRLLVCVLYCLVLWDSFVLDQEHLSLMVLFLMWTCSPFTLDILAVICNVLIFLLISFCFNPYLTIPSPSNKRRGQLFYTVETLSLNLLPLVEIKTFEFPKVLGFWRKQLEMKIFQSHLCFSTLL